MAGLAEVGTATAGWAATGMATRRVGRRQIEGGLDAEVWVRGVIGEVGMEYAFTALCGMIFVIPCADMWVIRPYPGLIRGTPLPELRSDRCRAHLLSVGTCRGAARPRTRRP